MRRTVRLVIILIVSWPVSTLAHVVSMGNALITVQEREVELTLRLSLREMTKRFTLDHDGDGVVSEAELASKRTEVLAYLESTVGVTVDGEPLPREVEAFGLETAHVLARVRFRASAPLENYVIRAHPLTEESDHYRVYGGIEQGGQWEAFAFTPRDVYKGTRLDFGAHALRFLREGVVHIFTGYDHVAFLVGLLLLGGRLLNTLKIVTGFTVAHSITLTAAALQAVILPSRLVESGIAFSIVAVAAENLSSKPLVPNRWLVAFLFGLIHGFGFASVLQELHLPTTHLVSSLFFFNSGVEVGQVAIVMLIFPLLWLLARSSVRMVVVRVASVLILVLGLFWLYERVLL